MIQYSDKRRRATLMGEDGSATNRGAALAFCFLVFVAVTKILLTKSVFVHVPTPVAFSALSCFVTALCMLPLFAWKPHLYAPLDSSKLVGFACVCAAIAGDLAFTNVAISLLSVALQQCIKAASPAATLVIESLWHRKSKHPVLYVIVCILCLGPILSQLGSRSYDSTPYGIIVMVLAVIVGSFKYVMAHAMIKSFISNMGTLGFTYWVEIFVGVGLCPWALLNGEAALLLFGERSMWDWSFLLFTAAYGGVGIYSQFALLESMSATTLALTNVAVQALTIILSMRIFNTPATSFLVSGIALTLVMSAVYEYVSVSQVLEDTAAPRCRVGGGTRGATRAMSEEMSEFSSAVQLGDAMQQVGIA